MIWKKLLIVSCLLLIVGINFYLYWGEFKVLVDPNDNVFQYALVDETRNIWKQIFAEKLSPFYLLDSWQERWAEGFALSSYYAHIPQAVISLIGLMSPIGMYKTFVVVRTLMLIFLPLMFFWGGTILKLPLFYCFIVSLFSQAIFTDGLYGIDASSFIFRGWGLSAQLMAVFFLPVAFAYTIDYMGDETNKTDWKKLAKAIFFNFLVASSHFGIFSLMLLGYGLYLPYKLFLLVSQEISLDNIKYQISNIKTTYQKSNITKRLLHEVNPWLKFIFLTLFPLSYFIVPFFLQGQYRNFSLWDPIWKFDSWGARQIIIWALNGELFDFGRLPVITLAVGFGVFAGFVGKNRIIKFLSLLFVFYTFLFFGRTTLGKIIDFIPGFSEYHLHRTIVMVQFTGIILGAWFLHKVFTVILNGVKNLAKRKITPDLIGIDSSVVSLPRNDKGATIILIVIGLFLIFYLEKPLINYAKDNAVWIDRSNKAYLADLPSYEKIKDRLASMPRARVYVGRPGNWGKQFTVGETPLYMVLSQDGYPVIGFLPESWSPNSDPEQFFADDNIVFYNLYNVGYSIMPADIKAPDFAKLIAKEGKYLLYQIRTTGWFDAGVSTITVESKKTNLLNMTRLWFASNFFKTGDYPQIDLSKAPPDGKRWYIEMSDRNNFINLNDGIERNIWRANPFNADIADITNPVRSHQIGNVLVRKQEVLVNGYKAQTDIKENCQNCILVLKQSFHPNWEVKVNGERVETFPVFPFYIGIPVEKAGEYEVVAEYKPNRLKILLIGLEMIAGGYFVVKYFRQKSTGERLK